MAPNLAPSVRSGLPLRPIWHGLPSARLSVPLRRRTRYSITARVAGANSSDDSRGAPRCRRGARIQNTTGNWGIQKWPRCNNVVNGFQAVSAGRAPTTGAQGYSVHLEAISIPVRRQRVHSEAQGYRGFMTRRFDRPSPACLGRDPSRPRLSTRSTFRHSSPVFWDRISKAWKTTRKRWFSPRRRAGRSSTRTRVEGCGIRHASELAMICPTSPHTTCATPARRS